MAALVPSRKKRKPTRIPRTKEIGAPANKAIESPENKGAPIRPPLRKQ